MRLETCLASGLLGGAAADIDESSINDSDWMRRTRKRVYADYVLQKVDVEIILVGCPTMTTLSNNGSSSYIARRRNSPTRYREPVMQMTSDGAALAIAAAKACAESGMMVK